MPVCLCSLAFLAGTDHHNPSQPQLLIASLSVQVDKSFPLIEASQAHDFMEAKRNKGKIILTVP